MFVHKQNFWAIGDGARDAKALHLSAGKAQRAIISRRRHATGPGKACSLPLRKLYLPRACHFAGARRLLDRIPEKSLD
jgi:hypothetical protein